MVQMSRAEWDLNVARIGAMIDSDGVVNVLGALLEALENMEEDMILDIEDFYETKEGKDFEHTKSIIELAIEACDIRLHGRDVRDAAKAKFMKEVVPDYAKIELYEKLRRMSPKEFTDIYRDAILNKESFDELVRKWP